MLADPYRIQQFDRFSSLVLIMNMNEDMQYSMFLNEVQISEKGDKRVKLTAEDVQAFPFNCIGLIILKGRNQRISTATGFLISSNLVLTAAHSLFSSRQNRKEISQPISFHLGLDGSINSGIKIDEYKIVPEYEAFNQNVSKNSDRTEKEKVLTFFAQTNFDYMLIKLKEHIQAPQYLKLYPYFQQKHLIEIYGYPGDKVYIPKQTKLPFYHQFGCQGFPQLKKKNLLYHLLDTSQGQSGSPILWKNSRGQYFAVGLHKGGTYLDGKLYNCGILFSQQLVSQLKQWEEEMKCCIISVKANKKDSKRNKHMCEKDNLSLRENFLKLCGQSFLQKKIIKTNKFVLNWNQNIPTYKSFKCSNLIQRVKRDNNDYLQLISSHPIPMSGTVNFKIKVKTYSAYDSALCFGVMAAQNMSKQYSSGLDNNSFGICSDNRISIGYVLQNILQKSQKAVKNIYVREGSEIYLWINMDEFTLTLAKAFDGLNLPFKSKDDYNQQFQIPEYLRNRQLFFFVTLKYKGDCIQIETFD